MAEEAYPRVTYHTPERPSLRALVRAREERKRELLRRGMCPCCKGIVPDMSHVDDVSAEKRSMRRTSEQWLKYASRLRCEIDVAYQLHMAERAEKREKRNRHPNP